MFSLGRHVRFRKTTAGACDSEKNTAGAARGTRKSDGVPKYDNPTEREKTQVANDQKNTVPQDMDIYIPGPEIDPVGALKRASGRQTVQKCPFEYIFIKKMDV